MRCSCLILVLPLFLWMACRSFPFIKVNPVGPKTEVEKAFIKFQDLNSTQVEITGELIDVRNKLLSMPIDAPPTRELTRQLAILNKRATELVSEVFRADLEYQAAVQSELEAKRQVEEQEKKAAEANKVVAEQGALRLYAFSIKSSPDAGTSSVVGEVENSGPGVVTDVIVEFELFDSDDKPVGTVSDHTPRIEPGSRWTFNALFLDEAAERAEHKSLKGKGDLPSLPGSKPE